MTLSILSELSLQFSPDGKNKNIPSPETHFYSDVPLIWCRFGN